MAPAILPHCSRITVFELNVCSGKWDGGRPFVLEHFVGTIGKITALAYNFVKMLWSHNAMLTLS